MERGFFRRGCPEGRRSSCAFVRGERKPPSCDADADCCICRRVYEQYGHRRPDVAGCVEHGDESENEPGKIFDPSDICGQLSGTLTLIASPPNLIVSQALVDHGFKQLSFFQITPIGVACVLVGVAYMYLVRNILLPKGDAKTVLKRKKTTPHELLENYLLDEHLHCVRVPAGSPAAGKKLSEIKLPGQISNLCPPD